MFGKAKPDTTHVIDSVLHSKTTIYGNVSFSSGMQIMGKVQGDVKGIDPNSVLVIGQDAIIEGSIEAGNVFIDGMVIGPVKGGIKVVVRPHGKITGDVHYRRIQIEEGAVIEGQLLPMPAAAPSSQSNEAQCPPAQHDFVALGA